MNLRSSMVQLAANIEAVLVARRWARLLPNFGRHPVAQSVRSIDASKLGQFLAVAGRLSPRPQRVKLSRTNAFLFYKYLNKFLYVKALNNTKHMKIANDDNWEKRIGFYMKSAVQHKTSKRRRNETRERKSEWGSA